MRDDASCRTRRRASRHCCRYGRVRRFRASYRRVRARRTACVPTSRRGRSRALAGRAASRRASAQRCARLRRACSRRRIDDDDACGRGGITSIASTPTPARATTSKCGACASRARIDARFGTNDQSASFASASCKRVARLHRRTKRPRCRHARITAMPRSSNGSATTTRPRALSPPWPLVRPRVPSPLRRS